MVGLERNEPQHFSAKLNSVGVRFLWLRPKNLTQPTKYPYTPLIVNIKLLT